MTHHAFGIELEIADAQPAAVTRRMRDAGIEGLQIKTDATPGVTCEIAFPPLAMGNFARAYIRSVCAVLADMGATVNRSCGMHVHISNAPLRDDVSAARFSREAIEQYHQHQTYPRGDWYADPLDVVAVRDIVARYTAAQAQIDSMHPSSRTQNRYCRPLADRLGRICAATNIRELQEATWGKFSTVTVATWQRGTIEFRQAAGTIEADKIINWTLFLLNLVRWTEAERVTTGATVTREHTTPERPYRPGSRVDVIWRMCRQPGGAHVRDLMNMTGTTAQNIRSRISEMRSAHGDDAVITHTQQANGHTYGDGIDLARYEIRDRWTTTEHGAAAIRDDAIASIWAGLDDDTFEWWQTRIEALAA